MIQVSKAASHLMLVRRLASRERNNEEETRCCSTLAYSTDAESGVTLRSGTAETTFGHAATPLKHAKQHAPNGLSPLRRQQPFLRFPFFPVHSPHLGLPEPCASRHSPSRDVYLTGLLLPKSPPPPFLLPRAYAWLLFSSAAAFRSRMRGASRQGQRMRFPSSPAAQQPQQLQRGARQLAHAHTLAAETSAPRRPSNLLVRKARTRKARTPSQLRAERCSVLLLWLRDTYM
ncbi:hypothetical protein BESB_066560 [Besnoitia besnoiti]|uniref:Uncharacterized protein n=1 Tax=Besnoitia besnoiti TaxID=94643 RepID=A0A2A9MG44_BESBE|nr:hypothetical protein BESB_066560 [Besnoitia besnoiti]PFH34623.1 hypothetical protein BESB_066560 [Besnoitia besnoiti]